MQIKLSATSDYTTTFLQKSTIVKVHSIFAKTINLTIFNQIFALQPKDAYLSPLSLLTFYTSKELVQLIQQIRPTEGMVFKLSFDLTNCKIYRSKLDDNLFFLNNSNLYLESSKIILINSKKTGLRNLLIDKQVDDFIFQAIENILQLVTLYFEKYDYEKMAEQLSKLIGLGIGLTPSGDDFICGVLAVLHKFGLKDSPIFGYLSKAIYSNLFNTNEISRAFLACALQNHFSQTVVDFFENKSSQNLTALSDQFNEIGHSSGIDTLCGIYFCINLLTKNSLRFK